MLLVMATALLVAFVFSSQMEIDKREPGIAEETRSQWDALLVDEFQDLDAAQYVILKRLGEGHRNVFVVGDDEQSIFSWRGADPRLLWRFRNDFEVEEIILDRNCRCSRQIFRVARRLMKENTTLFRKAIEAVRDSDFEVTAHAFEDEAAEAAWILDDLTADRETQDLGWGDYALLYRQHRLGRYLENRLVAAGVPCRLARGRSLLDDSVIAYVVASLRLMSAPDDPLAMEAFAQRMLPGHLLEFVRAAEPARSAGVVAALRSFARRTPRDHPDAKKAWRFIYHVENLRALYESHHSLAGLVGELLSQRVTRFENRLEDRYEELADPASYPGAQQLAEAIRSVVVEGGQIWIEASGGLEIALRGMLMSAEVPAATDYLKDSDSPGPHDIVIRPMPERPTATTLFKALQLIHSEGFGDVFHDYVTFDIETTDLNPSTCEIVELGAGKVQGGEIVDTFRSLVRCQGPISARATAVHGYTDADVRDAPPLDQVWPEFRRFVGDQVLIAHNGHRFDIPVLRRLVSQFAGLDDLIFFDTLPLARSLFRESARQTDLAERFGVDVGRVHHALDDAITLARVFRSLSQLKVARAAKAALVNLLDFLGLGLALETLNTLTDEDQLLLELARPYVLGRYSDSLEFYATERERSSRPQAPSLEEVIERLGGRRLMERIRTERSAAERYPAAVARLQSLIEAREAPSLEEGVRCLLERVALSTSEGVEADPQRVNLLTLHSTKGLEFSRVYVVGVEDYQLPGYYATVENRSDEIEEARRLLYVGMTRARDRLVLTRTDRRFARDSGGNLFLNEIGLQAARSNELRMTNFE